MIIFRIPLSATAIIAAIILTCLNACNQPADETNSKRENDQNIYAMLPDDSSGLIIQESIIKSGGLEAWQQKRAISYTKIIQQYDSVGKLINEKEQFHSYQFQPQFKGRIEWKENNDKYLVIYDGTSAKKFMNGQPTHSETDNHNAYDLIFGSYYVFCQPFKLADNGLQYTFEGKQMLLSKSVYSIKVEYPSTDSLAKPYPWWYYFNADDKTLLAYAIAGKGDRFGLTEFAGFETTDGIRLPSKELFIWLTI